jgi:peptidoglycan/xylan/chitin deacetylase (PgdA/CDA1 family)
VRPTLFRFPYGRTSATAYGVVGRLGLRVLPWNVDPSDYTRPGTETIIARVAQAVKPGSIVLLHDGGGDRSQTVAAITSLITSLRAAGYVFGTP